MEATMAAERERLEREFQEKMNAEREVRAFWFGGSQ